MLQHEENMGYHDNSIAAMLKWGETKGNAVIKKRSQGQNNHDWMVELAKSVGIAFYVCDRIILLSS